MVGRRFEATVADVGGWSAGAAGVFEEEYLGGGGAGVCDHGRRAGAGEEVGGKGWETAVVKNRKKGGRGKQGRKPRCKETCEKIEGMDE